MTGRLMLAAMIVGVGAAVPWSHPHAGREAAPEYTSRSSASSEAPMTRLASLLFFVALAEPLSAQDSAPRPKLKRQPDLIVVEEIDPIRSEVQTARDIVQRLRPGFLRTRGASSFGNAASGAVTPTPQVIVDGAPRGRLGALAEISASAVREIRYLNAADASIRYGTGYDGGAILVFTR